MSTASSGVPDRSSASSPAPGPAAASNSRASTSVASSEVTVRRRRPRNRSGQAFRAIAKIQRPRGEQVGYVLDPDGHVLALAVADSGR